MIYRRHYIQYNDLVFDEFDMISEDNPSASFKNVSTEYEFTHGAYTPYKQEGGLLRSSSVSLTITLRMKKIPCEYRQFYYDFVVAQLTTQGKLWAVQNNTLIWAFAHIENMRMATNSRTDQMEIDVDFELPEGVWHKADKQKTFLINNDPCSFMECYPFKEIKPCWGSDGTDCCHCGDKTSKEACNCCDCDMVEKEDALCYREESAGCEGNGLQFFYDCDNPYKIIYNCVAGEKFFGDKYGKDHIGEKLCGECGLIAGTLYSNTDIPTSNVTIRLSGTVSNPYIEINGNGNQIKGDYEDLTIYPDGSATYGCDGCNEIDVESWSIPSGMNYGWTVHQGNNRVVIDTGNCCENVCAYFMVDALTV